MTVIRLDRVRKEYARHRHLTRGLKQSLLHLPDLIRCMIADRFFALDDVSLEVQKGEAVGIIGANGSGKSTLLGLIAGVIGPQMGTVEVRGRVAPFSSTAQPPPRRATKISGTMASTRSCVSKRQPGFGS